MFLSDKINLFIKKNSEGENWDFKEKWYNYNADLVKDIICMANNTSENMEDGYIIIGIRDKSFNIIGVENDPNRKNTEKIVVLLNGINWASEEIPVVEVKTIIIDDKEIDILIIKNTDRTPYYLLQNYEKKIIKDKTVVHAGVIYSRVFDSNTSSAECANKNSIEFLWKKRFALLGNDEFKVRKRLEDIESWYSSDGFASLVNRKYNDIQIKKNPVFNSFATPEKSAVVEMAVFDCPFFVTFMYDYNLRSGEIITRTSWSIYLNGRKLDKSFDFYTLQITNQNYYLAEPEKNLLKNIYYRNTGMPYYFYYKNSFLILENEIFSANKDYDFVNEYYDDSFAVICVFNDEQEHHSFLKYINSHKKEFQKSIDSISVDEVPPTVQNVNSISIYKTGKVMVNWLYKWRYSEKSNYN